MKKRYFLLFASLFLFISNVYADQSFHTWLRNFKKEAVAQGVNPIVFDDAFRGITIGKRQLHFDKTQPEKRLTFYQYRNKRIDAYRIKLGKRALRKHGRLIKQIGREYGVSHCYILAIWGLETSYGHYMCGFDVIRSLATLAYDGRREAYFKKELIAALHILQSGQVPRVKFKGEWAGGSGHCQFMPSSWKKYAVDYNGDGKRNIWETYSDAFASMANYLKLNGWKTGQPTRTQVVLPSHFPQSKIGYDTQERVSYWRRLGVRPAKGWRFPHQNLMASIIHPYGGPDFMVFNNWRVLLKYNASSFYAGSISYLADKICRNR